MAVISKEDVLKKVKELLELGKKRNFVQSIDLSIALKGINFKNPAEAVEDVLILPHERGKKLKICALVDKDMQTQAKQVFDRVIVKDEFQSLAGNKKELKKIASAYDFFVAQANIMPLVAKTFGRVLGPRGKMPNPKASCVVPPNAKLDILKEKLKKTIILRAKKGPVINLRVGTEKQKPEEIADNVYYIISNLAKHLKNGEQNIKHVYLKKSMSESMRLM